MRNDIDVTFDFRSDTPAGKDPDSFSPTLRRYHKILWSKPLPCGKVFTLVDSTPGVYLHHKSEIGEFFPTSDAVVPTFSSRQKMLTIINLIPSEMIDKFNRITYTMGGMMIFPGNKVDGKMTINGQRGCHHLISDRFDLTVECIRLYYQRKDSPLRETIARYADFFDLFVNFRGYVEFFLLQDLVSDNYSSIRFFLPFEGFNTSPLPKNKDEYLFYMQNAVTFIQARNCRILDSI